MSSDRMKLLSCFANQIVVGPRLPFATQTTSRSAPKVYASKFISTYHILWHPDCSCCRDKVNMAAGRRSSLFFARHLDCFIVTQNFHSSPGLGTVKTMYHDPKFIIHLPGLAKNAASRRRRHLIKPPAVSIQFSVIPGNNNDSFDLRRTSII
jgi:hypothetical protein